MASALAAALVAANVALSSASPSLSTSRFCLQSRSLWRAEDKPFSLQDRYADVAQDVVRSVVETVVVLATLKYAVKSGRPDPIVARMLLREAEALAPFEPPKGLRERRWTRPARGREFTGTSVGTRGGTCPNSLQK